MKSQLDFVKFTKAIAEGDLDNLESRSTSHTSAVDVRDWERTKLALEKKDKESEEVR